MNGAWQQLCLRCQGLAEMRRIQVTRLNGRGPTTNQDPFTSPRLLLCFAFLPRLAALQPLLVVTQVPRTTSTAATTTQL